MAAYPAVKVAESSFGQLVRVDQSHNRMPFPAAIYYGEEKPPLAEFLREFVTECSQYEQRSTVRSDAQISRKHEFHYQGSINLLS